LRVFNCAKAGAPAMSAKNALLSSAHEWIVGLRIELSWRPR
jgi:hypothetical protein